MANSSLLSIKTHNKACRHQPWEKGGKAIHRYHHPLHISNITGRNNQAMLQLRICRLISPWRSGVFNRVIPMLPQKLIMKIRRSWGVASHMVAFWPTVLHNIRPKQFKISIQEINSISHSKRTIYQAAQIIYTSQILIIPSRKRLVWCFQNYSEIIKVAMN